MRITRPFVLLALAALLAPRADASRTSVRESNPPAAAAVHTTTNAAGLLAPLAQAGSLESIGAGVELVEPLRFDLGEVVLVESLRKEHFRIGLADAVEPPALLGPPPLDEDPRQPFELCDPETRIRGLELLPPFRVGASPSLSLWPRQACGFSCLGVVSDSRNDPWGLESGATFGAIDRRERGVSAVPPSYTAQEKAAATQRALGCLAFGGGAAWTAFSGGALGGVLGGFALMSSGGAACFGTESPIGMVVRETADAAARRQGVRMSPAVAQQQAENNANVESALGSALVGVGLMAPRGGPVPLRTDGPQMAQLPTPPAPVGRWVEKPRRSGPALEHQSAMSGEPIVVRDGKSYIREFEVSSPGAAPVSFDDVAGRALIDYKHDYSSFIEADGFFTTRPWFQYSKSGIPGMRREALSQVRAAQANGFSVEWRVGEKQVKAFEAVVGDIGVTVVP